MTDVFGDGEHEMVLRQELVEYLDKKPEELLQFIHELSNPETPADLSRVELIAMLGQAAHYLMRAQEITTQSSGPEVIEPIELEPEAVIEIPQEIIPEPETEPELTPVIPEVVEPPVEEVTSEPTIEEPVEVPVTPQPEEKVAAEPETEGQKINRIAGFTMSDEELVQIQKVVDFLSASEDRVQLRLICREVFGRERVPKEQQNRLVEVLNAYSEAGVLRNYGRTYGYRTEQERAATDSAPKLIENEVNPTHFEDGEIEAIKLIEELTGNGSREINIGEFVRTYFKQQRIDRETFQSVIARLNSYADEGYLVHAPGSAWYGLGHRRIVIEEPTADKPLTHAPKAEARPEPVQAEVPTIDYEKAGLKDREIEMWKRILKAAKPGEWFQQGAVNFEGMEFSSDSARRQAFTKLAEKLVEAGMLATTGKRGGKKYVVADKYFEAIPSDKVAQKVAKSSSGSMAARRRSKKASKPVVVAKRVSTSSGKLTQAEEQKTPEQEQAEFEEAMLFSQMLVRGVTNYIILSGKDTVRASEVYGTLHKEFDVSSSVAAGWIRKLIRNDHFHLKSIEGARHIAVGPAPEESKQTSSHKKEKRQQEVLGQDEYNLAIGVLKVLADLRELTTRIDTAQILHRMKQKELIDDSVTKEDINRINRILQKQGITVSVRAKEGGKRPLAKRGEVLKTGFASSEARKAFKETGGPARFVKLLKSGKPFGV